MSSSSIMRSRSSDGQSTASCLNKSIIISAVCACQSGTPWQFIVIGAHVGKFGVLNAIEFLVSSSRVVLQAQVADRRAS